MFPTVIATKLPAVTTTDLLNIPPGTWFEGELLRGDNTWTPRGLWLRMNNKSSADLTLDIFGKPLSNTWVVGLNVPAQAYPKHQSVFAYNTTVSNYRVATNVQISATFQ